MSYQPHYHRLHYTARSRVPLGPSARASFGLYHATAARWAQKGVRTIRDAAQFFNEARYAAREGHLGRRHITACFSIFVKTLPIKYQRLFRLHMRGTLFPILDDDPKHLHSVFKAIKKTFPIDLAIESVAIPEATGPLSLDSPLSEKDCHTLDNEVSSFHPITECPTCCLKHKPHRRRIVHRSLGSTRVYEYTPIPMGCPPNNKDGDFETEPRDNNSDMTSDPGSPPPLELIPLSSDEATENTDVEAIPAIVNKPSIVRRWPWDETVDFFDASLPPSVRAKALSAENDIASDITCQDDRDELVRLTKDIYELTSIVCAMDINGHFIHDWVTENEDIHGLMRSITIHRHLANFTLSDRVGNLRNIASKLEMYAAIAKHVNKMTGNAQVTLLPSPATPTLLQVD